MRPQLLKVPHQPLNSFSVRQDKVPYINNKWHYHAEAELIYFKKGSGTQFIGDHIQNFKDGDVVLVGSNLPHYWRFDDAYFEEGSDLQADILVAHFREDFWGTHFLNLPENKGIRAMLEKAKRGLSVDGERGELVAVLLAGMLQVEGPRRIMLLIEALAAIAEGNFGVLASIGFNNDFKEAESERINAIYDFTLANFKRPITTEEIAAVANISPHSFCRYFKSRTRKTYSQFINEIKVGHACRHLIEDKISVKQICFESGFQNFASFHKYFKMTTGKSPLQYQKQFLAVG
ncbi:AraC family transcriptional regulator [Mucilaginibacter ginsenosidivorans]|uniref:AraC family transcriptional regulator n=1 Tax=Mucilaginibacter ginsenosidivorans TaxID=398053 RepID=A0A5B8UWH6_9SPHI|nr:AraC family transcriptional regulator [Mucilaginibacter ginsenosidivorans]QEC63269.1 AraC family transcriptional regulator [Mucilaginibacter ginsenosidivorans]